MLLNTNSILRLICLSCFIFTVMIPEAESENVRHLFEVKYFSGSPDGVYKEKILGINGQFPCPTIEANVGDTLEIDVVNNIQDGQNTTIHWHGIHQKRSNFEDGTAQITQCPLKHGETQRYTFMVEQPGTYWYHSHVNSQYTEGMWGILIVHNKPEVYKYDDEITISLNDWYHRTAIENEHWHLSPGSRGVPPYPDSGLLNGLGRYPCNYAILQNRTCDSKLQTRAVFNVHRNKTYRVRVINTSAVAAYNFSIDGHILETIEVDGIDVNNPVPVDIASIAAAQRYSFLIHTKSEDPQARDRFLIRANLRKESLMLIDGVNINKYPHALMGDVSAVLHYHDENENPPKIDQESHSYYDWVPPMPNQNPVYLDENMLSPHDGISAPSHDSVDQEYIVEVGFYEDHENIRRGSFNRTPFVHFDGKPLLMKLLDNEPIPMSVFPLPLGYMNVVDIIINNPFFGPHPFHLHGHHFWVLGTGSWYDGNYDPARHQQNLILTGAKRDTVLVQEQSWAVIRFVADNPGVWTFHCHIDWHNLSGMALTFIEAPEIVKSTMKITDEAKRVCDLHTNQGISISTHPLKPLHPLFNRN